MVKLSICSFNGLGFKVIHLKLCAQDVFKYTVVHKLKIISFQTTSRSSKKIIELPIVGKTLFCLILTKLLKFVGSVFKFFNQSKAAQFCFLVHINLSVILWFLICA